MIMPKRSLRTPVFALVVTGLAAAPLAWAGSYTWTGGGNNPNWDDVLPASTLYANWGDAATLPGASDDVTFGTGFVSGSPNLHGSRTVNGLTIDSGSAFTLTGGLSDGLTLASGTLDRTASSSGTQTIAVPITLGNDSTWTLNGTGGVTFTGGVSDGGAGHALTLAGTSSVTFTGASSRIGGNLYASGGTFTLNTGFDARLANFVDGSFNITGSSARLNLGQMFVAGSALLTINQGAAVNLTPIMPTSSGLEVDTPATIVVDGGTLNAASGLTGTGTINLKSDPGNRPALIIGGYGDTFRGTISGAGSVLINMPSWRYAFLGNNTYTGTTAVAAGDLAIDSLSDSSGYVVNDGAQLELLGTTNLGLGEAWADAGGTIYYGGTLNGGYLRGPGLHQAGPGTFNGTTIGGDANVMGGSLTLNNVTIAGRLTSTGPLKFSGVTVTNSGQLTLSQHSGGITATAFESDGSLIVDDSLTNSGSDLTLGAGGTTTIDPTGALTLAGSTHLNVRGALLVNNGTINGPVALDYGATAKGTGAFNGVVTVNSNARFSPGNSPGAVFTSGAAWNDGGIYQWEISTLAANGGTPGAGWDLWNTGSLAITSDGHFIIELDSLGNQPGGGLDGWNPSQSQQWLIATATNAGFTPDSLSHLALNDAAFAGTNPLDGGSFSLSASPDGNNLYLNFTPVPEPASTGLFALAAIGLLWRRRRRAVSFRVR